MQRLPVFLARVPRVGVGDEDRVKQPKIKQTAQIKPLSRGEFRQLYARYLLAQALLVLLFVGGYFISRQMGSPGGMLLSAIGFLFLEGAYLARTHRTHGAFRDIETRRLADIYNGVGPATDFRIRALGFFPIAGFLLLCFLWTKKDGRRSLVPRLLSTSRRRTLAETAVAIAFIFASVVALPGQGRAHLIRPVQYLSFLLSPMVSAIASYFVEVKSLFELGESIKTKAEFSTPHEVISFIQSHSISPVGLILGDAIEIEIKATQHRVAPKAAAPATSLMDEMIGIQEAWEARPMRNVAFNPLYLLSGTQMFEVGIVSLVNIYLDLGFGCSFSPRLDKILTALEEENKKGTKASLRFDPGTLSELRVRFTGLRSYQLCRKLDGAWYKKYLPIFH